ncbi:MAG: hypothetical protein Q4C79_04915 [Neisseria sp.]|uniref:hypothetical protein n=1 Tax=Neisseria sp. TaxID=192066 RepID=UPI0026DC7A09|nr:hypothetical protein [Neisseria sp.]MDO4248293.1 hypothetical protein [Neisseria sp.]
MTANINASFGKNKLYRLFYAAFLPAEHGFCSIQYHFFHLFQYDSKNKNCMCDFATNPVFLLLFGTPGLLFGMPSGINGYLFRARPAEN